MNSYPILCASALYVLTARRSVFKAGSLNLRSPAGPSDSFPAPNKISNVLHPMTRVLNSICQNGGTCSVEDYKVVIENAATQICTLYTPQPPRPTLTVLNTACVCRTSINTRLNVCKCLLMEQRTLCVALRGQEVFSSVIICRFRYSFIPSLLGSY